MDVLHSQMGHYPVRVLAEAADVAVQSDVESDLAQLEGDEIVVARVQRKLEGIVVEAEHPLQVVSPEGDPN